MGGFCKFYKQKRQVSYDSGTTWEDVTPYQYDKGDLYESYSSDCGYMYTERWVNSGYTCSGQNKFYTQLKQVSTNGGQSWYNTSVTRTGDLAETNSVDCGWLPKLILKTANSYVTLSCVSSSTVTYDDINYPSNVKSAEIGDCVTSIENNAFTSCSNLTELHIPSTVTSIGDGAFYGCSSLSSLFIPDSVTSIGYHVFNSGISISNLSYEDNGMVYINDVAYKYNGDAPEVTFKDTTKGIAGDFGGVITSITMPNTVTSIGPSAFRSTCISSINSNADGVLYLPSGITRIDYDTFWNCNGITYLGISSATTYIGRDAFGNCSKLQYINPSSEYQCEFPESIEEIGIWAFRWCSKLGKTSIPSGKIQASAFTYCSSMEELKIGSGVTFVGPDAFNHCTALTKVTVEAITPPLAGRAFPYTNDCPIYVPAESVEAYKAAEGWGAYRNRIYAIP